MTQEDKTKTIDSFKQLFSMFKDVTDIELEMYYDISEEQAIANTKPAIKRYSVALWMAYLLSLKEYNSSVELSSVGVSSKTMGDRSESYSQGNNLDVLRADPRGFLAQYKALYDQYTNNNDGMFFMSAGPRRNF